MKIKVHKGFGKHYNIGWWCVFNILPVISVTRAAYFAKAIPAYSITISWLVWSIEINNNKFY